MKYFFQQENQTVIVRRKHKAKAEIAFVQSQKGDAVSQHHSLTDRCLKKRPGRDVRPFASCQHKIGTGRKDGQAVYLGKSAADACALRRDQRPHAVYITGIAEHDLTGQICQGIDRPGILMLCNIGKKRSVACDGIAES